MSHKITKDDILFTNCREILGLENRIQEGLELSPNVFFTLNIIDHLGKMVISNLTQNVTEDNATHTWFTTPTGKLRLLQNFYCTRSGGAKLTSTLGLCQGTTWATDPTAFLYRQAAGTELFWNPYFHIWIPAGWSLGSYMDNGADGNWLVYMLYKEFDYRNNNV